jgi:ABC-type nickel/cobalt efflux system permease component RcnA
MEVGLALTAFALGLRHGVDWDHVAAIVDLSGTAENRRRGFVLSLLYVVGHAVVVLVLGAAAVVSGAAIPDAVDAWMGRFVGLTLVVLGAWVLVELARRGREFRLRSRFMLVLDGTFAGLRRVRRSRGHRRIHVEHEHPHDHDRGSHESAHAHDHAHDRAGTVELEPVGAGPWRSRLAVLTPGRRHSHRHGHDLDLPDRATARYGNGTATAIGVVHGVGVESPTQIAAFVTSTSVVGVGPGLAILVVWVTGLVIANTVLALTAGLGLLRAERSFGVYAGLAVVVSVASIGIGTWLLVGG